jgi:hypothetical protein
MRRCSWSALVAVVALSLTGCGGDDADARPDETSTSATDSASSEPSASAEPGVAPATGPEMQIRNVSLRVPKGHQPRQVNDLIMSSTGPEGDRVSLFVNSTITARPLDDQAAQEAEVGMWQEKPRRVDDVTVDGVEMFHLQGKGFAGYPSDVFGAQVGGNDVTISILTFRPARERAEIVESVLASVTWS